MDLSTTQELELSRYRDLQEVLRRLNYIPAGPAVNGLIEYVDSMVKSQGDKLLESLSE